MNETEADQPLKVGDQIVYHNPDNHMKVEGKTGFITQIDGRHKTAFVHFEGEERSDRYLLKYMTRVDVKEDGSKDDFKIGDRIRYVNPECPHINGKVGEILQLEGTFHPTAHVMFDGETLSHHLQRKFMTRVSKPRHSFGMVNIEGRVIQVGNLVEIRFDFPPMSDFTKSTHGRQGKVLRITGSGDDTLIDVLLDGEQHGSFVLPKYCFPVPAPEVHTGAKWTVPDTKRNREFVYGAQVAYRGPEEHFKGMTGMVSRKGIYPDRQGYPVVDVVWKGYKSLRSAIHVDELIMVAESTKAPVRRSEGDKGLFGKVTVGTVSDYL